MPKYIYTLQHKGGLTYLHHGTLESVEQHVKLNKGNVAIIKSSSNED